MSSGFTTPQDPEYVWQLATLFPGQGEWTDSEYLDLTDQAKRRIEFTDGRVEFLTMPTEIHEALVRFLFLRLYQFVDVSALWAAIENIPE
jgi:Uma2 family endonuclease